jgi:imidazoleglycerol-phosphate dehydratase
MLEAFGKHGLFDIQLDASGDVDVDQHHTVEDIGLVLGQSVQKGLGDKKGINRSGFFAFPMDDSLGIVSIDLSGRSYLTFKTKFKREKIGDLDSDLIKEFFSGFSMGAGCNVAVYVPYGDNDHHKAEAIFKAFGKALMMACSKDKRIKGLLTTKGLLDKL